MLQKKTPSPSLHKRKPLLARVRERVAVFFWEYERYKQNHYGTFDSDLLEAADHGFAGAAKVMLKKGANVNTRDKGGNTPLLLAVQENNIDVCEVLIEHGADVFAKNKNGMDALTLASRLRRAEIAALFVRFYLDRLFGDSAKPFYHAFRDCVSG